MIGRRSTDTGGSRNVFVSEIAHALRYWIPISRNFRKVDLIAEWRFPAGEWDSILALRPEQKIIRVFRALKFGTASFALGLVVPLYMHLGPALTVESRAPAFVGPQLPFLNERTFLLGLSIFAATALAWIIYRVHDRYSLWTRPVRVRIYPFGLALNSHLMRWDGPGERVSVEALKQHPHGLIFSLKHPHRWNRLKVSVFRVAVLAPDAVARDEIIERLKPPKSLLPDLPGVPDRGPQEVA